MDKLQTFAAANGWTVDNFDTVNDKLSMHRGTIYVHFHWDNTDDIGMFQSLGYVSAGTGVGSHTDDSGNLAAETGAITSGHVIDIDNGPYTAYHFFDDNSGTYPYLHVVVEYDADFFRHFTMGQIEKFGTWTGGEFACGNTVADGSANEPYRRTKFHPFDGNCTSNSIGGYLHVEGLPNQAGSGKWGVFGDYETSRGNDTAAVARAVIWGGVRNGPITLDANTFPISSAQAFVPFQPITVTYCDTSTTPDHHYLLGFAPDMRSVNIDSYVPGEEITFGGDTWKIFPWVNKSFDLGSGLEQSGNAGVAYKKLV